VHSGSAHIGHYWAFAYCLDLGWVKYNDSVVSAARFEQIQEEAYGGESSTSCAYCLVYARKDFG